MQSEQIRFQFVTETSEFLLSRCQWGARPTIVAPGQQTVTILLTACKISWKETPLGVLAFASLSFSQPQGDSVSTY